MNGAPQIEFSQLLKQNKTKKTRHKEGRRWKGRFKTSSFKERAEGTDDLNTVYACMKFSKA